MFDRGFYDGRSRVSAIIFDGRWVGLVVVCGIKALLSGLSKSHLQTVKTHVFKNNENDQI